MYHNYSKILINWKLNKNLLFKEQFKYLNMFKKINLKHITYFISFILLIIFSPLLSLIWLCLPTLYFLYTCNDRDIDKIWASTLIVWYFIFTVPLSISTGLNPIIIGSSYTEKLLGSLLDKTYYLRVYVFKLYILNELSIKLRCLIHIPVLFQIHQD